LGFASKERKSVMAKKEIYTSIVFGCLALVGLHLTSLHSYLLFHSIVEIFSIVVACGIFMLAWNARRFLDNTYLLFLGIAYLFVGGLDLLHTLAYTGMGVFEGYGTDLPTQLWIAARYLESLSLLVAPLLVGRKLRVNAVFLGYASATSLILGSIFYWNLFPVCFIEGAGLTPFKKISEYVISLILVASIAILLKRRRHLDVSILRLLIASIVVTIASELAFTLYVHAYGLPNMIGHYLKIVSFYLIYVAIIEKGLARPYALLFRDLKQSEEALRKAHEELERRVEGRTAELAEANKLLKQEIEERNRAEEELRESENQLRHLSSQLLSAQENERKSLAQDLHDSIGQTLAAIKFGTENVLTRLPKRASKEIKQPLEATILMVRNAIEEVRRIQTDLRPPTLDDLGILATISWFCREFQTIYSRLRIEKHIDIQEDDVPGPLKTIIYRVMQEALNNIAKHSRADRVRVSLKKANGTIELAIEDNGLGFDLKDVLSVESSKRGFGISSMKERVELSGGSFVLASIKGAGTTIRSSWPDRSRIENNREGLRIPKDVTVTRENAGR
jgi:signal transduction histidine kinase